MLETLTHPCPSQEGKSATSADIRPTLGPFKEGRFTPPCLYWLWFVILLAVGPVGLHAQNTNVSPMLDEQNGFFDFTLGDTMPNFPHLVARGPYERKQRFAVKDFPLVHGDVKYQFIHLLFYQNRLHSIYLRTEGLPSSEALLQLFQALYGPGAQQGFGPLYFWEGTHVRLTYDRNLLTGNADIVFTSRAQEAIFSRDFTRLGGPR